MTKTREVVKSEPKTAILIQSIAPEWVKTGTNRGSENVGTTDIAIPRLEILQGLSPAVKRGDPGHIKGAEVGMFINSVSRQLYGDEAVVIPIYYTKQFLVWKMRKWVDGKGKEMTSEGGFLGAFETMEEAEKRSEQERGGQVPVEIIDTPQHFCLMVREDGDQEEIMVSMPRTKAKISRQWNSMIRMAGGDRFSRAYKLTTALEKNSKGDFYNFEVELAGYPSEGVYKHAERVYESIAAGARRVVMDVTGFDEPSGESAPNRNDM